MAYAQWIEITIQSRNINVSIKNAAHSWGKFFKWSNKDDEMETSTVNNIVVKPQDSYSLGACGRSDAASGTEGSIDLFDGNLRLGTFTWDCPWGSKTNTWSWNGNEAASDYAVQMSGGNRDSGAIGQVILKCGRFE